MKLHKSLLLSAVLALLAVEGRASSAKGRPGSDGDGPPPPPPFPILEALDANGDKVIDADEIAAASTALKALDLNKDGKLDISEVLPPPPDGDDFPPPPPPRHED